MKKSVDMTQQFYSGVYTNKLKTRDIFISMLKAALFNNQKVVANQLSIDV
jgi:hypothetical protein